jgi:aspartate carbamoyltransferase catalytic subunit
MNARFDDWPHVLHAQQFSRGWIEKELLPLTDDMEVVCKYRGCNILAGKSLVSFFYQPSTRTRMSFEFAMKYLGGTVGFSTENAREFSSGAKGETLQDTVAVLNRYNPDVIVMRYDHNMGSELAAQISDVPIINAGDRNPGQHPTQALLDIRTIFKRHGTADNLNIAMVGDLKNGRTVRSLSYLLGKFNEVTIYFVSPKNTRMKGDVKKYLRRHGVAYHELTDLREVASIVDVVYQTRTQTECGSSIDPKHGHFTVNKAILDLMREDAIVMHPLPRVDEITVDVDNDPRAVYRNAQIDSGLFVRMALLKMILAPKA